MHWIARILGTILLLGALVPIVFDYDSPGDLTRQEVYLSVGFWVIVAGLIVAWRFMLPGALLILTGVVIRVATYFVIVGPPWTGTFYPIAAVAGFLYLIAALRPPAPSSRPGLTWAFSQAAAFILFFGLIFSGVLRDGFFQAPWVYDSRETRAARAAFEERDDLFAVTLFPIHVIRGPNTSHEYMLTQRFADYLSEMNLARPLVTEEILDIPVRWGRNQARMFRRSRETCAQRIRALPVTTPYALMVEILAGQSADRVGGIHYYLADRNGLIVDQGLINSHHDLWRELQPESVPDAYELLERWVCEGWTLEDPGRCVKTEEPPRLLPHEVKRPSHQSRDRDLGD